MVTCSNPQAQRYPRPYISSLFQKKNILDQDLYTLLLPPLFIYPYRKKPSNVISKKFANSSVSGELFSPPYSYIVYLPFIKHSII